MNNSVKNGTQILLLGLAGFGLLAAPAMAYEDEVGEKAVIPEATEESPTADASVGLYSKYVWRGFELSKDSLVIQPSLTVGYKGFSANYWSNVDTDTHENLQDDTNDTLKDSFNLNETDVTLAYDYAVGPVGMAAGYIYYDLDGLEDSQEIFLSAGLDTLLNPTLTVYREVANYPGWYITLEASHAIPLTGDIALDLGAKVSYWSFDSAENFGDPEDPDKKSAFHDGLVSASVTFPVTTYFSVTPELYYSFALSDAASNRLKAPSVNGDDDNFIYGGVSASFSF
jgi:hypothetical protein